MKEPFQKMLICGHVVKKAGRTLKDIIQTKRGFFLFK